ncbi:protein arginine methyltransferase NDUFAF7, mitochondrial [Oratosquilla oratoria]|uniref:protein arginine methyltransferase NDUFAF7, mitochondrial n=1 Tax=Oratosquilla oratoria TaxID=337810 RepID=UPI003F766E67
MTDKSFKAIVNFLQRWKSSQAHARLKHGVTMGSVSWCTRHQRFYSKDAKDDASEEVTNQSSVVKQKSAETPLLKQLKTRIKFDGPLTVHDYMREVLTNPYSGYYMNKDVFGAQGDFITSPEICQMFGELLGIWVFSEWYKVGSPKPLKLVEFGPGRGTLMQDILRVLGRFDKEAQKNLEVHFVEVSPHLSDIQEKKLCGTVTKPIENYESDGVEVHYKTNKTVDGFQVYWHRHLAQVPYGYSIYIAQEFLDALPVHKLLKTDKGWREILIDVDEGDGPHHLRYILSKAPTPASSLFPNVEEKRDEIEVCPEAGVFCQELAVRMEEFGGAALIIDYGHSGDKTDTFRGFKNHQLHDPLCEPGSADLTADVDFSYLKQQVEDKLTTYGPVPQGFFLKNMGIELRLTQLLKNCPYDQQKNLISSYNMLVDADKMGQRFKVMAFFPAILKDFLIKYPPGGVYRDLEA